MLALATDTATTACVVALGRVFTDAAAPELLAVGDELAPRAALSRQLPIAADLLSREGLEPSDIELVVVGLGPGSYTGVRIGLAGAKGLAAGLGVPLLGVGSLDAVAWGLADHGGLVGVVADAMRQEVYPALFRCRGGKVERLTADRVADPASVAAEWALREDGPILLAGDGLVKHADVFLETLGAGVSLAPESSWLPTGSGVLDAAHAAGPSAALDPGAVLPVYTRLSDAEHREDGRTGLVPGSGVAGPGEEA